MHLENSFHDKYEFYLFLISDYSLSALKRKAATANTAEGGYK